MKTVEQLKSQIYSQVQTSGFLKNVQAQVKSHVLDLIDKQTRVNKERLGFEYEHPVLKKLRNYPLTSLCMDLIQQFLESFKFKHTLNVFKKEINRDLAINRKSLGEQFNIELGAKDQSILLSIVNQITKGDIKIVEKAQLRNNFVNDDKGGHKNEQDNKNKKKVGNEDHQKQFKKYDIPDTSKSKTTDKSREDIKREEEQKKRKAEEEKEKEKEKEKIRLAQIQKEKELQKEKQRQLELEKEKQSQKDKKGKGKKKKIQEKEKPSEKAEDFVREIIEKMGGTVDKKDKKQDFHERRVYSQEKQAKKIVPQQSGSNKIRGISMGKMTNVGGIGSMGNFMKFSSFNTQNTKQNEYIDEEVDDLQQSRDSIKRNPLYSSSQSGFDKSNGYDQSVDSIAIEDYQYVQKARKFTKK